MNEHLNKLKSGWALALSLFLWASALVAQTGKAPKTGEWRGMLQLREGVELPVPFSLSEKGNKWSLVLHNASENIEVNDIHMEGDSLLIRMPLYDSEFRLKCSPDSLRGVWINHARKDLNILPFYARYNWHMRYDVVSINIAALSKQNWEVTFSPGTADSSKALGMFFSPNG